MEDTVTCLVRGPGSSYPRGYVWLIPVWCAVLSGAVVLVGGHASGRIPLWLGATEVGGLLITTVIVMSVILTARRRAFRADSHGIWLGVRTDRRRPKLRQVHLAWPEIAQLRMVPRRYGVLVEITLGPAARIVRRNGPFRQAALLAGVLVMPLWFGRGKPALTVPRLDPPRYYVKICGLTAADFKLALAGLPPPALPVRVLTKKSALRFTVPPPRKPQGKVIPSKQPPAPVA